MTQINTIADHAPSAAPAVVAASASLLVGDARRRVLAVACGAAFGLAMAGAALAQDASPDTGSMAYPAPRSTGEFQRLAPTGVDTGNMAYPSFVRPGQTVPSSQDASPDTGSMAYPAPRGSGAIRPSTVR